MPISEERKETLFGNSLREERRKNLIKAAVANCSEVRNAQNNPAEMD